MAGNGAWRSGVSFSERLTTVMKISSKYREAHSSSSAADATSEARLLENQAFEDAASLAEYENLCESILQDLVDNVPKKSMDDLNPLEMPKSDIVIDLGPYKDCMYLKHGLFSTVYKAAVPAEASPSKSGICKPGDAVALKLTIPSTQSPPHDSVREVRILNQARGSNVILLLESFRQPGNQLILVLPYIQYDLETLLTQKQLPRLLAVACLRDVFRGLAHLHSLGIIHRDVKPSNILVDSSIGPAYLSDFGIAWSPTDPSSEPADDKITDVGTTHYRPPELLFGNTSYGISLDLWAAGCVCAEVFSVNERPNHDGSRHWTLFDSGELGSELALISSIFSSLGTPDVSTWPEVGGFKDWGKMEFFKYPRKEWAELLPVANETERDLVSKLVVYESGQRMRADEVLKHKYFWPETVHSMDLTA